MDRPPIKDNKTGVPLEHYGRLFTELEPTAAIARSGVRFDSADERYLVRLLGREVEIPSKKLEPKFTDTGDETDAATTILLGRLLLEGRLTERNPARFLAYAEMPWGELYNANFQGRCILRLAYGFGFAPARFAQACESLGGTAIESNADAAYELEFVDGLMLRLMLWAGDDEFPPSSQILFSDNFRFAFDAEDMAVVGDILINTLKAVK